ncbi:MAG: hypothetical protein ACP5VP_11570 [Candidatus Limnocylindrales bacterium]
MSDDERFTRDLRKVILERAPASVPPELRARVAGLREEYRPRRRVTVPRLAAALAAGIVVVALAVASLITVPRSPAPLPGAPSSPPRTQALSASPSPTLTASPGQTAHPTSQPSPSTAASPLPPLEGWTFAIPGAAAPPLRSPDGTVYVATGGYGHGPAALNALDPSGHPEPGWPFAPSGVLSFGAPQLADDGTVYVQGTLPGGSSGYGAVWALDPQGRVKDGWPYPRIGSGLSVTSLVVAGDGTAYVSTAHYPTQSVSDQQLVALDPSGHVRPGWPVAFGSIGGCQPAPCSPIWPTLGSDGAWYALVAAPGSGPEGTTLVALRPDGTEKPGWPVRDVANFALGPDGLVYAWSAETSGVTPSNNPPHITRTTFRVLNADGTTRAGWPVTIEGPASAPAIGPDGTLYTTTGDGLGGPERIVAFGLDGLMRSRWPYAVPSGIDAWRHYDGEGGAPSLEAPFVGSDGTVYLAVTRGAHAEESGLLAVGSDGVGIDGWPVWLPAGQQLGQAQYATPGSSALVPPVFGTERTLYLAIALSDGSAGITAIDPSGKFVSGWPFLTNGQGRFAGALVMAPDGMLYGIAGETLYAIPSRR